MVQTENNEFFIGSISTVNLGIGFASKLHFRLHNFWDLDTISKNSFTCLQIAIRDDAGLKVFKDFFYYEPFRIGRRWNPGVSLFLGLSVWVPEKFSEGRGNQSQWVSLGFFFCLLLCIVWKLRLWLLLVCNLLWKSFEGTIGQGSSALWVSSYYILKIPAEVKVSPTISLKKANEELMKVCKHFTILSISLVKNWQKVHTIVDATCI